MSDSTTSGGAIPISSLVAPDVNRARLLAILSRWRQIRHPAALVDWAAPLKSYSGWRSVTGNYRKANEDAWFANDDWNVYLIADGVGGSYGGAAASQIAVATIPPRLAAASRAPDGLEQAVEEAFLAAHDWMRRWADADPDYRRMATTLALGVVCGGALYLSHIGDCRAYLLRRGVLRRLTKDETVVQAALDAGLLTQAEAREHRWRHVVTNTLGVKPPQTPYLRMVPVEAGDRLLLTTDGLTDVVGDDRLCQLLAAAPGPQSATEALVDEALRRDSKDNVSCIVVELLGLNRDADRRATPASLPAA